MNFMSTVLPTSSSKKRDLSILFGNAFDHYDIAIYSFLAPIFGKAFFPSHDPVVQLILTYSVLAISLISHPVGAFIFGKLAGTRGPNIALSYTLIGVALSTVLIGLLPTYESWSWLSPLCLVILRIIRGIFAAGETTIAKLYILEGKTYPQALKASYIYQSSSMYGIVLASALSTLVSWYYPEAWRLCFIFGGMTGFMAFVLRRLALKHDHQLECAVDQPPINHFYSYSIKNIKILWHHRANVLRVAITDIFGHVTYIVPFVFMNSFVPMLTDISYETMLGINTALLLLDASLIPIIGPIVARYNPVNVMVTACLTLSITIIPLFQLLEGASLPFVIMARVWILVWGVVFLCPLNFWCKSLFNTPEKYFLVGMGSAIGAGTLGRTLTPIFFGLWHITNIPAMPAVYMTAIMLVTAIAIFSTRKRKGTHIQDIVIEHGTQDLEIEKIRKAS